MKYALICFLAVKSWFTWRQKIEIRLSRLEAGQEVMIELLGGRKRGLHKIG